MINQSNSNFEIDSELLAQIEIAAKAIKSGNLAIFPTETVYGLGANALNPEAVAKIYAAKGRPAANPVIVHISNLSQLESLTKEINDLERLLIKEFWPGPLTIIFTKSDLVPSIVAAGGETVAVRMPMHQVALKLIELAKTPIAAPSANISGKVSPTHHEHLEESLMQKVAAVIEAGKSGYGLESTVVRVVNNAVHILRPGSITKEQLVQRLKVEVFNPEDLVNKAGRDVKEQSQAIKSPGTNFKHYSPNTKLILLKSSEFIKEVHKYLRENIKITVIGSNEMLEKVKKLNLTKNINFINLGSQNNLEEIAANIYSSLIEVDKLKSDLALIHDFPKAEVGVAIMDRLERAAGIK